MCPSAGMRIGRSGARAPAMNLLIAVAALVDRARLVTRKLSRGPQVQVLPGAPDPQISSTHFAISTIQLPPLISRCRYHWLNHLNDQMWLLDLDVMTTFRRDDQVPAA